MISKQNVLAVFALLVVNGLAADEPGKRVDRQARIKYADSGGESPGREPVVDRRAARRGRSRVAGRRRRILFNDDSEALARPEAGTPEGFLAVRLLPMIGTQVDTICFSALAIWGDAPIYDSKVQPLFGQPAHGLVAPGGERYPHYALNARKLIEAGNCPLKLVVDFAHAHRIEAFASIRMNDVHDSFVPGIQTIWKREHPEYLVKTDGKPPVYPLYVTAQDYTHQAVRDRKVEVIEDIGRRYDVDGFELDYIRHPVLFSSVMQGGSASDAEVAIMTSFMTRIRRLSDELAGRRKRPILLAARVPDTFAASRKIGLDVENWLKRDLVDILIIGGGYSPFSLELDKVLKAAHRRGVPVYPCLNSGPLTDFTSRPDLHPAARAVAGNWHRAGADGVYLWNLGTVFTYDRGQVFEQKRAHYFACLKDIGLPRTLARRDKLFTVDGPVFAPYVLVSTPAPLPVSVTADRSVRVPLKVADDVRAAARSGLLRRIELELVFAGQSPASTADRLSVELNGRRLRRRDLIGNTVDDDEKTPGCRLTFRVTAPPLDRGVNRLKFRLADGSKPLTLTRVHLRVDYE